MGKRPACKDYHTQYEPIWYGWKDGDARLCPLEGRKQSDLWVMERPRRSDEYPTMKPVSLIARAIENSSKRGDLLIDFFSGSGTALIAAEQTVRTLPMPGTIRSVLAEWKREYTRRFGMPGTTCLVFPNKDDGLRSYPGFRRQFERFLGEKGLGKVTFHQFRHTFATMMLESGVNPRVVQEFLGHKDISTTLGIYTGVTSVVMQQAADGADIAIQEMI